MQCPPFGGDDLRLVSEMCSDPLTRAMRNVSLAFRSPVWSEESCRALVGLGEKLSGALLTAIRRKVLPLVDAPDWPLGVSAIERVFGLERRPHLFRAEPIAWAKFTEPQFTKGFAHFLNAAEPAVRIGRVRALLTALGASPGEEMSDVEVTAEAPASRKQAHRSLDRVEGFEGATLRSRRRGQARPSRHQRFTAGISQSSSKCCEGAPVSCGDLATAHRRY